VVRDEPKFPALDAVSMPATMSFKLVVQATDQKIVYDDPLKQFRVRRYAVKKFTIAFSFTGLLILLFVPGKTFAKAPTVKITISGGSLSQPIDITDPEVLALAIHGWSSLSIVPKVP
jgi:hypothetical protein